MYRYTRYEYSLDPGHGLGIVFDIRDEAQACRCFFEDGTLTTVSYDGSQNHFIRSLRSHVNNQWPGLSKKNALILEDLLKRGAFRVYFDAGEELHADVSVDEQEYRVRVFMGRYSCQTECSCGKPGCVHIKAAAGHLESRIGSLQHMYICSSQPVDKSLFLDPCLTSAFWELEEDGDLDEGLIGAERDIVRQINAADSDDYIRLFHRFMMNTEPGYDYDARFLEDTYSYLLFALFDDPGYRKAVLDTEYYAAADSYEERQQRSNRACLKRVLKDYNRAVREVERQNDFTSYPYKEFLLKYRGNMADLLRYYAEGKEDLEMCDIPFLERIAEAPEIDLACIPFVAEKLDFMSDETEAVRVFHLLLERLPFDSRTEVYSRLENITMSLEEIRELPPEIRKKQIGNMPLTGESFCYALDNLIPEDDFAARGRYILRTVHRLGRSNDMAFKKIIAERAAALPDSRLLLAYVLKQLGIRNAAFSPREGSPAKELGTYFSCAYDIVNEGGSFYSEFDIFDPESSFILLHAVESDGAFAAGQDSYAGLAYSSALIRELCLAGREEEYREAYERNQDETDAFLFEKEHARFAREYREFCTSLKDEKLLFAESGRAGIEWLLYRAGSSNAMAFRVGHGKMYVVKSAGDFINAFKTGQTIEYGKDLILTHDTDNLNGDDAAVIKLLMAARITKGRKSDKNNKRYITVSDSLFGSALELLSGRGVFYNDMPCTLRMDPCKIRLRIDSRYMLSCSIGKTQEFLNLAGRGYLVSRDEKDPEKVFIDRIDGTAEEMGLIDFVMRNPSVSVKPILKDFRKNIYSRFFELFDVDKAVRPEFMLSQIRLNTYFDLEGSVITAKTVIMREGKEIWPEDLTERIDQVKYELLQNYLSALGFSEGALRDESRVLAFLKLDFTRLKSMTNVYLSENLQNKELKSVGRPVIRVTYQNNIAQVFLEKSEYSESELEQIITGLRKKKKYILLSGDRIVDLDSAEARDFGEAVGDLGLDPKDLYEKKTISMVSAIKAFSHERSCRPDKYLRDMIEEIRGFKEADIPLPKISGELRNYQVDGFKWLTILAKYGMGGILADDMGLGKTLQVIALLLSDRSKKPSLVVCPKSLVFNWVSEFARFDGTTRVVAVYGPDSRRSDIISSIDYKEKAVYITSYDSLRNDIGKYGGEFNYGILDEAQYIKNVHALKTKSVKELNVRHRFALTGTPIENSVVDLWSIFDYIMPGYFEELSRFRESDTAAIARRSGPFILRRVKDDVLEDLPPKYERILSAEMSDGQRRVYDAMRMDARKRLEEGGKAFDMLPYLTRLRQICVDPSMFVENYTGGSGKLDMLSTLIPEYLEQNHRILIFSQFVKALESVDRLLKEKGIATYFLSGATSAKDRIEMMDSFNNGSGTDVFLISLKAGGTGLNLTGADTVIHLDPWWNVAAENQASDRTHRIGQKRNVEVIRLIAADSIEQRVVELQDIKKEVIRQVISDDDGAVTSASLEDISFVLE